MDCKLKAMGTRTALCFGVMLLAAACGRGSADYRQYTLQGQILSIGVDRKEANIKHEAITGFMAAMTMPYKVLDARELESLAPGDLITSTLVVVSNDAYLKDVRKVGSAPLEKPPAEAPTPSASSGFELLKPGEPVPDGAFVDHAGRPRTMADYRGWAVVVTFIYSTCPMPTFCPLMDRHFAALQEKLRTDNNHLRARLVSVTIDPITDTPDQLAKHAATLHADPQVWTFLTGKRDDLDKWAMRFGLSVSRAMNDQRDITHNLRTVIIDRQGVLVKTYTGNEWTPDQVLADLQMMVRVD
jgi:protein SCO1/2